MKPLDYLMMICAILIIGGLGIVLVHKVNTGEDSVVGATLFLVGIGQLAFYWMIGDENK